MSFHLADDASLQPIPHAHKAVLIALAFHADGDGSSSFPGMKGLQARTSLSERTIRYALRALEDKGLIAAVAYRKGGQGRATVYQLAARKIGVMAKAARAGHGWTLVENPAQRRHEVPGNGDNPSVENSNTRQMPNTRQKLRLNPAGDAPHSVLTLSDSLGALIVEDCAQASGGNP